MKDISPRTDPSFWSNWIQSPAVLDRSRARRFRPQLTKHFRDVLGISTDAKVLEVGCGPGTLTRFAAQHLAPSGKAWGIDRDATSVAYAQQKADDLGLRNAHFQVADACALPFEDGSFNAVTSYTVLEHVQDTERFFQEQIRVCTRDGTISVMGVANSVRGVSGVMPFEGRLADLMRRLSSIGTPLDKNNGIGAGATIFEAASWLEQCGLREIRVDGFYQPFCLRDSRYDDCRHDIVEQEFVAPMVEHTRFLIEQHPDLLGPDTITTEELRELTLLYAQFHRTRLGECHEWIISDQPSLIISGRRP